MRPTLPLLLIAALGPISGRADEPAPVTNPFSQISALPYHLPPFDRIRVEDFRPGFETGMAEQKKEIEAIAKNPQPPTFENTIVAMERTGALLDRVSKVFFNLSSSNSNPEIEKIEAEMVPKLSVHRDGMLLDTALFARVDAVYQKRADLKLDPESAQLLDRTYRTFVHAGAKLSAADKTKLKALNEQISALTTQFQQNVLKATKDGAVVVDQASDLDGFSPEQIGAAALAAKARGLEGKWLITLQNTTIQPALAQLKNRALRKRIFEASVNRGVVGDSDNRAIIAKIVKARAEAAKLLGFPNRAAYALEEEGAATPKAVNQMLGQLAPAALANAKREAADIQKAIDAEAKAEHRKSFKLEPWDWAFYAEKVMKAHYAFDESQVKPYLELDRVLQDGVFFAANQLFGLTFKERKDLPVYHPDVRVFEVFDADGSPMALFLADLFARDAKRGGAWMNNIVDQSRLLGFKPVVINNLNVPKPAPGQPALLTFDEVTTLFHEFGHGLHGMLSNTNYPQLSGTSVPPDFVEFPSQYNEMWATEPAVLAHYAKHYQTGEPMPKALLDKVLAAEKFGQGFKTTEYLAAAMLDQSWHQIGLEQVPDAAHVQAFEKAAIVRAGLNFGPIPPRYHSGYFLHIFSDEQYAAGYYAYLWSEVLARDTEAWMHAHGGLNRANGDFLRAKVLSRGRTAEPAQLFREFYGRDPEIGPLLEHRGLGKK